MIKDADFIFQQDLAPAHTAKSSKSWLNDHGVGVLDWSANSPVLNPTENLWGIVKRKKRPKNADKLKATVKETGASIPPEQFHKLITSMPRWIEEEELFICHTHTIIQSITSSEMCCLHLTHPSAHNWSSGQQTLRRTGSSLGFGALLKDLTSVVDNSCRSRD